MTKDNFHANLYGANEATVKRLWCTWKAGVHQLDIFSSKNVWKFDCRTYI